MHIAIPVYGVPKIMPVATDRNKRLIKVPRVALDAPVDAEPLARC
jgi:hypothetical protein